MIDSFNTTGVLFPGGSRDSKPIPTSFLYTAKRGTTQHSVLLCHLISQFSCVASMILEMKKICNRTRCLLQKMQTDANVTTNLHPWWVFVIVDIKIDLYARKMKTVQSVKVCIKYIIITTHRVRAIVYIAFKTQLVLVRCSFLSFVHEREIGSLS